MKKDLLFKQHNVEKMFNLYHLFFIEMLKYFSFVKKAR